ncbi:MAG: GNVR domain-containing protein [Desulfobulbus sp.]|jgi:succinoglycan biosynthesis transport protein ExoP
MDNLSLTPGDYWGIVKRRKWSLIVPFVVVLLIAVATAFLLPPVYESSSTILIEEQHIPTDFVMTTVNTYAEQRVQSIKQRVLSFSQLFEIIQQQNLYPELKEKWTPEEVVAKMRSDVQVEMLNADVFDPRTGRPATVTTAFTVTYAGKEPRSVLRVTDTLTSLFLEENLQARQQQVSETSAFLASEAQRIKEELAGVEKEIALFKEEHINELPELFQVNKQILDTIERNIDQANGELRSLKEREALLAAQMAGVLPSVEAVTSRNREAETLQELRLQLAGLRQRYTDAYPDIAILKSQIAELEQRQASGATLSTEANRQPDNPAYVTLKAQIAATRAEMQMVRKQVESLEARANIYRKRIEATPHVEGEYLALVNHRNALQTKYNDLTIKHQEAKVAQELEKDQKGERFTLIDPARLPEQPVRPNRLLVVVFGVILASGVGVGCAALREMTDQSVRSAEMLAALVKAPVLATIPRIVTQEERQRQQKRRVVLAVSLVTTLIVAVLLVHFFVMDLDVLWAKASRRAARL